MQMEITGNQMSGTNHIFQTTEQEKIKITVNFSPIFPNNDTEKKFDLTP